MDCLRSFNVSVKDNALLTAGNVKTWLVGVQEFFAIEYGTSSTFNVQGFKNINIYGVQLVGYIQTLPTDATGGCIVEDWSQNIYINGQLALVGGFVTSSPDFWNIDINGTEPRIFALGKYQRSINFGDPLQSVSSIEFQKLSVQGIGGQTVDTVSLDWDLVYTFYYKYEGE